MATIVDPILWALKRSPSEVSGPPELMRMVVGREKNSGLSDSRPVCFSHLHVGVFTFFLFNVFSRLLEIIWNCCNEPLGA